MRKVFLLIVIGFIVSVAGVLTFESAGAKNFASGKNNPTVAIRNVSVVGPATGFFSKLNTPDGPDRDQDRALASRIRSLTNRSSDGLVEEKLEDGTINVDLQGGFQNVMISRAVTVSVYGVAATGEPAGGIGGGD